MKLLKVFILIAFVFLWSGYPTQVEAGIFRKKKKEQPAQQEKKETKYDKLFKDKQYLSVKGLFSVHKIGDKVFFEVPQELFGKDMLIGSTITTTTDNRFGSVGEKTADPLHVRFIKTDSIITLRWVPSGLMTQDPIIEQRLKVSNTPAVIESFEIEAYNNDSTTVVIDMTDFLLDDNTHLPPFSPYSMLASLDIDIQKSFERDNSQIINIKAFEDNVSVQSSLTYNVDIPGAISDLPFTTVLTRSFILLPEEPMRPRLADPRIGIFFQSMTQFNASGRGITPKYYANRWRLEPSDEEAYKRGELVEPKKPIVFYVDDAFPEKWKPYIHRAVERWQYAFEQIGFKNAIVARDFPKDDPEFDPDNLKYSCIRYSPSTIANAMGPSWTDPRTGEIINASVMVYHNVIELVQMWRYLHTAAADKEVRDIQLPEDILSDCIEYVLSHEVGHCLSLMHNMAGSSSIPVDSLRSPSFTQKYGTTYSIMDYARNNYIAQPGDKERGVKLTPPELGVYDLYAIKWLYTPLFDAHTPEEEVPTLDKWISEKSGDPIYRYGKQQFMYRFDPSALEEDLGDDPVKASQYGIANLKYILAHTNEWVADKDKDFRFRETLYGEVISQYVRYLSFVLQNIGGIYLNERYDGDARPSYSTVSKTNQKRSLDFLLAQLEDLSWLDAKEMLSGAPIRSNVSFQLENSIIEAILGQTTMVSLCAEKAQTDPYTRQEYLSDIADAVWTPTRQGKTLSQAQMKLQQQFVSKLIDGSVAGVMRSGGGSSALSSIGIRVPEEIESLRQSHFGILPMCFSDSNSLNQLSCNHATLQQFVKPEQISGFSFELDVKAPVEPIEHIYFGELQKILPLVKSRQYSGSEQTRQHYRLLVYKIEQALQ